MRFPKLCAIDIDGTLVGPEKNISSLNATAIDAYTDAGGIIILSSGRMYSSIRRYGLDLGLPGHDIILAYNGGMAKTMSGDLLFERPVPAHLGQEIIQYCDENDLHLNFYYEDQLYVKELDAASELYMVRAGSISIPVGNLMQFADKSPTKLLIIGEKEQLDALVPYFEAKYQGQLYVTKTDDEYLEFMAAEVNKGTGLKWVADKFGIQQNEIAAFGDSYNDVQMIEWAGLGIAMSNGRDAAIHAADLLVDNSDWSGVGRTLLNFVGK